jgi:phosphoglycolate phosphatase-like HAD superfamily hydrolase
VVVRAAVFDFDGTLVQSANIKRQAYVEVVATLPDAQPLLRDILQGPAPGDRYAVFAELERRLQAKRLAAPPAGALAAAYTRYCDDAIGRAADVPGAAACLRQLSSAGVRLHLVSRTPTEHLRTQAALRPWGPAFAAINGSPKPKRATLAAVASEFGADSVVMVSDDLADAEAALGVGCRFVGVQSAGSETTDFGDLPVVNDLTALPAILAAMPAARH